MPLDSDPFANIFVADGNEAHVNDTPGWTSATAWDVSSQEQIQINAAREFTKKRMLWFWLPTNFLHIMDQSHWKSLRQIMRHYRH